MPETAAAPVEEKKVYAEPAPREEKIRIRAYELYLSRNCEPGHAEEDWFRAESEVAATPGVTTAKE